MKGDLEKAEKKTIVVNFSYTEYFSHNSEKKDVNQPNSNQYLREIHLFLSTYYSFI